MGAAPESSSIVTTIAPLLFLVRSLVSPLLSLPRISNVLHVVRRLVVVFSLLLLHLLPSFLSPTFHVNNDDHDDDNNNLDDHGKKDDDTPMIGRALRQLLSLLSSTPVSSRKYDVVRSLAEMLLQDNLKEKSETLRQINCEALSFAFGRTLAHLEAALLDQENNYCNGMKNSSSSYEGIGLGLDGLGRAARAVKGWCRAAGIRQRKGGGGLSAEKMAAELLWLAEKMEESGGVTVALEKWARAEGLGSVALAAEPRVQASLVKLTAFLIKQMKVMDSVEEAKATETKEQQKQMNMKLLMTWIPLLCNASNGTEAPTLSTSKRGEIERVLEELIDSIDGEESQEKVLSLWLHQFIRCSSSDWPNLSGSYTRWCNVSRELLLTR